MSLIKTSNHRGRGAGGGEQEEEEEDRGSERPGAHNEVIGVELICWSIVHNGAMRLKGSIDCFPFGCIVVFYH